MKRGMLFWGFQNLELVSSLSKKMRQSGYIQDFYIQILESEKTISLIDIYPEEIIRATYTLSHLLQWLNRNSHKDVVVVIDMFNLILHERLEENTLALKQLLELKIKIFFMAPKIITPQGVEFIQNEEFISLYKKTLEYSKINRHFYEILLNSSSTCHVVSVPVPETMVLNQVVYSLFQSRKIACLRCVPRVFNKLSCAFVSSNVLITKVSDALVRFIKDESHSTQGSFYEEISSDKLNVPLSLTTYFKKFELPVAFSLERFFHIKGSTPAFKFITWLVFLAVCEGAVKTDESSPDRLLGHSFFPHGKNVVS